MVVIPIQVKATRYLSILEMWDDILDPTTCILSNNDNVQSRLCKMVN